MKAFKRSSFSPHNRQPLTLHLLIQGLFRTTTCTLQHLNLLFFLPQNFYQPPACSILSGSPCSNSPTRSSQGCHQTRDSQTPVCLPTHTQKKKITPQEGQIGEDEWTWVFCGFMHFVERYRAILCPIWSCHLRYAVLCLCLHIRSALLTWFFNLALPAVCCDGDRSWSLRGLHIASWTNEVEMWLGQKKVIKLLMFHLRSPKIPLNYLNRIQIQCKEHAQNSWLGYSLV